MNCKKIKEMLFTDYIDAEIEEKTKKEVEVHLDSCADCRKLKNELNYKSSLFKNAQRFEPSESIWNEIKKTIENEKLEKDYSIISNIKEYFNNSFLFKKPVFITSIISIILFISLFFTKQPIKNNNENINKNINNGNEKVNEYLEEQINYIINLDKESNNTNGYDINLGTGFEEHL